MKKISLVVASFLLALIPAMPVAASVNDFMINDFSIDYYISKNKDDSSHLRTVEKIEAVFKIPNQNHGIERAIPTKYDGHTVSLKVDSVTDENGNILPYSTYSDGEYKVLRIGDADKYVYGVKHYVIEYTQRDVTKYFGDSKSDEFYWDTNGTEWKVPINLLRINLHIDDAITTKLNGATSCYRGTYGADESCEIVAKEDGYAVTAYNLSSYENVTIAVGFKAGTFEAYKPSLTEILKEIWIWLMFVTFAVAFVLIVVFIVRYVRKSNRKSERGTIIPEYLPPKYTSVTAAATISGNRTAAFSAQLIDLAVRHYLKIYQVREKSFFKQANYELEIIKDIAKLSQEERELLTDIFAETKVGSRLNLEDMKKRSAQVAISLSDNQTKLDKDIRGRYGLRAKDQKQRAWFWRAGHITLAFAVITFSPWLLIAAMVAYFGAFILYPLTEKGLSLARYLEGLKLYIKVAEKERLKILQSPQGAEKTAAPIDTNDKRQMIKLYERVLPYAVLFGQEKKWNQDLGRYYESLKTAPDWYAGNYTVFNAAVLSNAISSFNTAATYSNPTSSSSSGSGGGGFSGGGGGGGGGGGW